MPYDAPALYNLLQTWNSVDRIQREHNSCVTMSYVEGNFHFSRGKLQVIDEFPFFSIILSTWYTKKAIISYGWIDG